mmetsp:Transcript_119058/g.237411  ORF Transcript_119058/g.237411 Transcript_119058/m.237411 type:complete len:167 (+) Transcript_119058:52-552(+)
MASAAMSARTPRTAWGPSNQTETLSRPSTAKEETERFDWRAQARNILASDRATVHGLADASRRIHRSEDAQQHERHSRKALSNTLPRPQAFVPSKLSESLQQFRVEAKNTRLSWNHERGRRASLAAESDIDVLLERLNAKRLTDLLIAEPLNITAPEKTAGTCNPP